MNNQRRIFLRSSLAAGMVGGAVGLGLLTPRSVLAAWSEAAFSAESVDISLVDLYTGFGLFSAWIVFRERSPPFLPSRSTRPWRAPWAVPPAPPQIRSP